MVSSPSPFQSPATGRSPAAPKLKLADEDPALLVLRRYQLPLRNTPMESSPSRSQSPITGRSPATPNPKLLDGPELSADRRYQVPLRNTAGRSDAGETAAGAGVGQPNSAPAPTRTTALTRASRLHRRC